MSDPIPAGPDPVIDRAAWALAENVSRRYDRNHPGNDLTADDFIADAREDVRALAAAGLLANPAQLTLLPRLAELAAQAGKLRTADWLTTCSALSPGDWPPAPGYKGAVLHVEDAAKTSIDVANMPDEWLSRLAGLVEAEQVRRGVPVSVHADEARAERDRLKARLDAGLRTCDATEVIAGIGAKSDPDRWKVAFATVTDVRAALQGDQPGVSTNIDTAVTASKADSNPPAVADVSPEEPSDG
jgi:hypothetical protein